MHGYVTLADGGVSAPGAVLTVTGTDGLQRARTVAGPDGAYSVGDLPADSYTVIVTDTGFDPQAVTIALDESAPRRRDFVLSGGGVLTGSIRSRIGTMRATVVVMDSSGSVVAQARTDEDGSFRIDGLPPGDLVVTAAAEAHQPVSEVVRVEPGTPSVAEMVLSSVGGATGTVRMRERPVAGATVTAVDSSGTVVGRAVTDDAGAYRVEGLTDGGYTLVTSAYQPAAVRAVVSGDGEAVADIVLRSTPVPSAAGSGAHARLDAAPH
nr:carboxypeptidase regulatory-like domain-containing protein [Rhodococcus sp. HNM0569]